MLEKVFQSGSPGRLVPNLQGLTTFVPNELPPPLPFLPRLWKQSGEVENLLGRLDGSASALPDRQILVRSFVRREAQLSSYIENTFAGYDEVAAAEKKGGRGPAPSSSALETLNAELAIKVGIEAVFDGGQPISLPLIRQMHSTLLRGVRGEHARGRFRDMQVYIGSNEDPRNARFVPPPPHMLEELMSPFMNFLATGDEPPLVQLGLLHYQFETIHPFEDGNGRLGRILILLGLCQYKLLAVPVLNASLYFERNRQEYYDRLLRVSTHGDWEGWLSFFIAGLRAAAIESLGKLDELSRLRQKYRAKLQAARNPALLLTLVDHLFTQPRISVSDGAAVMKLSYPSAFKNIQKLLRARILKRVRDTHMPTIYVADEILRAVNAKPTAR